MSSNIFYDNIQKYLFQYVDLIEHSNSVGLTDKAVHAENLFAALLNIIFNWELVNANEVKVNQDSFDLIYETGNVCIQVTTNKSHKAKFNRTVKSFQKNSTHAEKFIVLFISKKVKQDLLDPQTLDGISFESYDIPKLLRKILYGCPEPDKLEKINRILELTVNPVRLERIPNEKTKIPFPFQQAPKPRKGIIVKRNALIRSLFDFAQQDNGLLIGGPGFGKSFLLEELQNYASSQEIPCWIIRINELGEGSANEIGEELNLGEDWLGYLEAGSTAKGRPILIFDAFDTAKDERLKTNIIKHIRKAIERLSKHSCILVSVRTYDAAKSRILLELFPATDIRQSIPCRNFQIPILTPDELETAFQQSPVLESLLINSNPQLRELLRTPYFLKLFEQIALTDNATRNLLGGIRTEEQLLEIYWANKVEDDTLKEIFLSKLTALLAGNASLIGDKSAILTESNAKIYEELTSLGIIEEVSLTRQKITFTHNILLDYAISKYLLKQDANEQVGYIGLHEKLPFIFRQSFIYFYTKLYLDGQDVFWQHYRSIMTQDTPLFRLFHQTVLNYVLISFYNTPEDLEPLLSEQDTEKRAKGLRKVLESIRFITKGEVREKDIELLQKISIDIHWLPLWEASVLIEKGIEKYPDPNLPECLKLSNAACNCLESVMEGRKDTRIRPMIDRNGSLRGINNLCKTLPLNKKKVKKLFLGILEILKEDNFPIDYFFYLSNNIELIFKSDSMLGSSIYQTLYLHTETSDRQTDLGGSSVMPLRSNRRQDYGMVYYGLENSYPKLLDIDFSPAMQLGLEISGRANHYHRKDTDKFMNIKVGELKTHIYSDYTFMDDDRDSGPSSHLFRVFENIQTDLSDSGQHAKGIEKINCLLPHLQSGMVWRRLFKLLIKNPEKSADIGYKLLINRAFYIFDETVYEAGELIRTIWQHLAPSNRNKIEETVLSLITEEKLGVKEGLATQRVVRLLNCIPKGELQSGAAVEIVNNNQALENIPIVSDDGLLAARATRVSREEKINYAGYNLEDDLDMLYYSRLEEMQHFNESFEQSKEKPTRDDYSKILPYLEQMGSMAALWTGSKKRTTEHEIARTARIISTLGTGLKKAEKLLIKSIALGYIQDKSYQKAEYEPGELKNSHGIFGPSARTASVGTLVNLMCSHKEKDIERVALSLMQDHSQIVRFKALKSLVYFFRSDNEEYWKMLNLRCRLETDGMNIRQLLLTVCYDDVMKQDLQKVEAFTHTITGRLRDSDDEGTGDVWKVLTVTLLKLIIRQDSTDTRKLITANLDIKIFCRQMIFEIMTVIDPHAKENDYVSEPSRHDALIGILMEMLEHRFANIHFKGINSANIMDDFAVIDHIIQHLFFTIERGRRDNRGNVVLSKNRKAFYNKIRPLLNYTVEQSTLISSSFMIAHTGYYFMQMLNNLFDLEPAHILDLSNTIVICAAKNGFTYDSTTLKEVIKLTERIIVDHKEILYSKENFNRLLVVLDQFASSGWQEALEMTWRLKEAF